MLSETQHPKGTQARVLLTSVFGPYAQDDEYGSRSMNPMELYHNQVTRVQGAFSLRMFHRSWGLMMIQTNIAAPSTLLDFPTLERFTEEIREHDYDIIGISSIVMNVGKVKKMCDLIRHYRPGCRIVIGGHISNLPGLESMIDADFIVRGEGVNWMRRYLGEDDPAAHRAPGHHLRLWRPHHGGAAAGGAGRRRCRTDPVGRVARWGVTSARPPPSLAARGISSTSTNPGRSCSRS